jgi:hypothetical protein
MEWKVEEGTEWGIGYKVEELRGTVWGGGGTRHGLYTAVRIKRNGGGVRGIKRNRMRERQ